MKERRKKPLKKIEETKSQIIKWNNFGEEGYDKIFPEKENQANENQNRKKEDTNWEKAVIENHFDVFSEDLEGITFT